MSIRVKLLEWQEAGDATIEASTPIGRYTIHQYPFGCLVGFHRVENDQRTVAAEDNFGVEQAKALAQQDFEAIVLSCCVLN